MKRISPKSRKVKLPSGKRPQLSQEHQQRIQKFRQSNTPLRDLFREDLTLHKFAPRTIARYLDAAITFVAYFNRPPQFISDDEIRAYLRYQSEKRRLKSGSMGIIHGMLKYLYTCMPSEPHGTGVCPVSPMVRGISRWSFGKN